MRQRGFGRILLATDGSEESEAAARLAAAMAGSSGATRVRIVHCWNLEVHHRHGVWDVETRSEAEKLIAQSVAGLLALNIPADGEVVHADTEHVGAAIAAAARQFDADVVVVGSRGLGEWRAMREHSVSHQVLSAVGCPVLIVREAGASILREPSRVVLALAGGSDIEPGVHAAIAAASTPGSTVLVLHVAQAVFGPYGFSYLEGDNEIHDTVTTAASMLKEAGIPVETMVAEPGPVARTIADAAVSWNADIIVTGSSRMGDLASIMLGSVTYDLMRATKRPVLVAARTSN
jgi:nucleotide-binding universal stress UspA family protein